MSTGKLTAWHVGRSGEVAGGMTQVVNGYLSWSFERFDVKVITSRDGGRSVGSAMLFLRALWRIARLGDRATNVVVVHLSQGGSFVREGLLLMIARWRGLGTVAHLHGSRFVDFAERRPGLVGWVLRGASRVIVLSDATREAVTRFVPAARVALIQNAVPAGTATAKERLVVFGGSVTHRKGVDVLVRAWRALQPAPGWQLCIAGPISEPAVVDEQLDNARWVGAIEHKALMSLLERASIAVLPSRDEAMPMFILEALARDNCVISTRVGGIPSVLGDGRGVLVEAGNVAELTAALRRAMEDASWRAEIAVKGRAAFDASFSARAIYPVVERLWSEALQRPGSDPAPKAATTERAK